jgi:hypothetical protein
MQKPQTINGMNKEKYFWFRNNATLLRSMEGWVPETDEQLEQAWREGLVYERYRTAKEKDKPKRWAEYQEYLSNHRKRADAGI